MLTVYENYLLEDLARDIISQVKNAIENKPIKRKTKAKGSFEASVNASGKLANSLRFEINEYSLKIYCLAYIDNLIYGQAPSRIDTTVFEIENWINSKGLELNAVSVLENLQQYGSSIFQEFQGSNSGLLADVSFESKLNQVREKLVLQVVEKVKEDFKTQIKAA